MNTLEILTKAKALIANPANWSKGTYARDGQGRHTQVLAEDAVCFCTAGAVLRATGQEAIYGEALQALTKLDLQVRNSVETFNDLKTTRHADIMRMFDKAIAAEKTNASQTTS